MEQKYEDIKRIYSKLHETLMHENHLPLKYLESGVWAPSIPKEVYKIFTKYGDKEKTFLDLGSGDGLVVMIASLFFKHAYGVELDLGFFNISKKMKDELKIENVTLIHDDFHNPDLSKYDFMFIAPDKEFTLRFENKLSNEMDGKLIVYSSIFQPKTLNKVDHFETNHFDVFIYENKPKKV